jgi:DDE domain
MHLWRAVDAEGEVLDVLLQPKRDTKTARQLMRKLLKTQGMAPNEWVTDKNPGYGAALRELQLTGGASYPARAGQQSSGKLARSGTTTRAKAARVQVAGLSPVVLVPVRSHLQHLHGSSPSCLSSHSPPVPSRSVRGMAKCGRRHSVISSTVHLAVPLPAT